MIQSWARHVVPVIIFMCLVTSVVNAQATGTISGTVTDTGGTGLSGVGVQIYDASGSFAGFGSTDGTGQYTLGGLPTGTYFARTFASSAGYINELYDDLPCFPSCDVTTGTPIAVAGRGDDERDRLRPCPYRGDADPRGAHHGAARSDRRPACQPVPVDGRSNHP